MGDIKKLKKNYSTPAHPWVLKEIEEFKILRKEYGLTGRKEILIANSFLKHYKDRAKKLIATKNAQSEKEKKQMIEKLMKLGLLNAQSGIDDVLNLQLKDILERRIQTLVFRKSLGRTIKQARQMITHRHVSLGTREVTSPGKILTTEEENKLTFKSNSPFLGEEHPERKSIAKEIKEEVKAIRKKDKKDKEAEQKEQLLSPDTVVA